jgi:hypothetical protein
LIHDKLIGGILFLFKDLKLLFDDLEVVADVLKFEVFLFVFGFLDCRLSGSDPFFKVASFNISFRFSVFILIRKNNEHLDHFGEGLVQESGFELGVGASEHRGGINDIG